MTENSNEDYWAQFVPKSFEMDPENDDLLMGDRLRDGMVVLIEDDDFREDVSHLQKYRTAGGLANAKKHNRWATVSNFQILDNEEISFFAVYQDGVKKQMRRSPRFAWYVKLDSIPDEADEVYYTEYQISQMSDEQLKSIREGGMTEEQLLAHEEAELKAAVASLVETSKVAWSGILDMLKTGVKEEADLLDEAASRLWEKTRDLKFSEKPEDLGEEKSAYRPPTNNMSDEDLLGKVDGLLAQADHNDPDHIGR